MAKSAERRCSRSSGGRFKGGVSCEYAGVALRGERDDLGNDFECLGGVGRESRSTAGGWAGAFFDGERGGVPSLVGELLKSRFLGEDFVKNFGRTITRRPSGNHPRGDRLERAERLKF